MSLTHALLGLLAVQPRSGYELSKAFSEDLGRYAWAAGHTSIYPELNRMAEKGLVEVTAEGARGARTYGVTAAGRDELRSWLLTPQRPAKVRNEQVLRMFLLSALEPADALAVLHRIEEHTDEAAVELRKVRESDPEVPMTGAEGFGHLAAEYGLRQYEATRDWARWAIARLEGGPR